MEGPPCDGQRDHANGSRERTLHTMALDQSALLEVLEALKAAEVDDRIRQAAETITQALKTRAPHAGARPPAASAHRGPHRAAERAPGPHHHNHGRGPGA